MKTSNLSVKLTVFLAAAVAIAIAMGGGMYGLLRKLQTEDTDRIARVLAAKNTTYQLLETMVDAQAALQDSLRLKDPDEIEKAIGHFKERVAAARQLIKDTADLPAAIGEKMTALVETDQQAIDKFLVGENSAAFELMITTAPERFGALLQVIREHSASVEAAVKTDAAAGQAALARNLLWAAVICAGLVLVLIVYGWRFRQSTTRQLRSLANSLGEASNQVASAAGQVSVASQSLADGSTQQAASLEETSASLEEMAGMTKRNADNATNANGLASQARQAADTGASDMQAMSTAMHDIKTSSDDIAKIIKTIDEIAFQTNILALNAAVEAARAGEAGMGFAVVAEEVRNLAHRSAQAAKETAAKIEGAIGKTAQGVEISGKVARSLTEIVEKVRQVDALVAEVATASREQSQGVEQINSAVTQMDKVVQSNSASAEESAAAAEELNAQAAMLKDAVSDLQSLVGGASSSGPMTAPAEDAPSRAFRTPAIAAKTTRHLSTRAHSNGSRGGNELRMPVADLTVRASSGPSVGQAGVEAIEKAIGAHGTWKNRLKTAIDTGQSDVTPDVAAADNQCAFGQWLYSLPADVQDSPKCQAVKEHHACFHREAAGVLDLALGGEKEKAMECVAFDGTFTKASAELTQAMLDWKREFAGPVANGASHFN